MLFLKALWDKIQNYVIITAFVYGGIVTTLYYRSDTHLKEATIKLQQATDGLKVCSEAKHKLEESHEASNNVTYLQNEKLRRLEGEKDSLLERLAQLPRKDCKKSDELNTQEVENEEIDIDSRVPDDISKLLDESYNNYKRKTGVAP